MKHVVIAVPAYTWQVHIATMRSIIADLVALTSRGDKVTILDESGSGDLADARAVIVAQFLATTGTHLVNIDADVCWPAGSVLRLVDAGVECVGAAYPMRIDELAFPVRYLPGENLIADPVTKLLKVRALQGGFVCYTRGMLERMTQHYEALAYRTTRYPDGVLYGLFDALYTDERRKLGEDYAFFERWGAMGGEVWCDPEITMGHIGFKMFHGSLGNHLRGRTA